MKKIVLIFAMFWALSGAYGQAVHTKGEKVGENGTLVDSIVTESSRLINYVSGTATPVWTDANDSIPELRTDIDTNTATGVTNGTNISSNSISISTNASGISDNADTATAQRVDINNKGDVHVSGTPEVDQLAIWTNDSTIKGDALIGVNAVGLLTNQVNEATEHWGVFIEGVELIDGVIEMVHGTGRAAWTGSRGNFWSSASDSMLYWTNAAGTYAVIGEPSPDTMAALRTDINALQNQVNDTISFSDEMHSFPFGIGGGTSGSTGVMVEDAYMGGWHISGDTVAPDTLNLWCEGTGGSVTIGGFYAPPGTARSSGTSFFTAEAITTTGGLETITTFSPTKIPPGNRIWLEITAVTTEPTLVLADLVYHKL